MNYRYTEVWETPSDRPHSAIRDIDFTGLQDGGLLIYNPESADEWIQAEMPDDHLTTEENE